MGQFTWFLLGVSLFVASPVVAAQAAPTAAFPPAHSPAAAATGSAGAVLPPAPPPPPATSPATPASPGPVVPAGSPPPAPGDAAAPAAPPAGAPPPAAPPQASPIYAAPPPGYGYYYPSLMPRSREHFADNAAVTSVPFIDVLVASTSWQNRVSEFLNVGLQAGTYVAGRLRLSANVLFPTSTLNDDYYDYVSTGTSDSGYYNRQASKPVTLFYGLSAGIVAVSSPTFVMSPGIAFSRTDVSDYGSVVAFALPFEWVTSSGLRLGLEFDAGRAFGGQSRFQCFSNFGTGTNATCANGPTTTQDRPTGTSILLQFQLGFGFNHPDPLPPEPAPSAAPYGWPAQPQAPAAAPPPPVAPTPPPQ